MHVLYNFSVDEHQSVATANMIAKRDIMDLVHQLICGHTWNFRRQDAAPAKRLAAIPNRACGRSYRTTMTATDERGRPATLSVCHRST
jgi:hypothetical protein